MNLKEPFLSRKRAYIYGDKNCLTKLHNYLIYDAACSQGYFRVKPYETISKNMPQTHRK